MIENFQWKLAQRFVNDYSLPIPILNEGLFEYHLHLYENEYHSLSAWGKLQDLIGTRFNGKSEDFLKEFYNIRERIVTEIPKTPAFKDFNTCNMQRYEIEQFNPRCSTIYNETNVKKYFLTIDLCQGNFQALNFVNKEILLNSDTYEEFISKFTDLYYIKESKYFRQVIFGQMNPKRHITVEKYIIRLVYDLIQEKFPMLGELVVANADELIFETTSPFLNTDNIISMVKEEIGINVHCDAFLLNGFNFFSNTENHKRCTFYTKTNCENKMKLMCVPLPYHSIIYKIVNGMTLEKNDYHFNYENIDCIFNDTFHVEIIS